jgi:flagellar basal-body rod protein FlgF
VQISSFLTVSKQTALMRQTEVTANNLANASTNGYRRSAIQFSSMMQQPNTTDVIAYPFETEIYIDFSEGALQDTGNPLDLAILSNSQAFFVVEKDGERRLTRNGNFRIGQDGSLQTAIGETVLGDGDQPIKLNTSAQQFSVAPDGSIYSDNDRSGRVRVVQRRDNSPLSRVGTGAFRLVPDNVEDTSNYSILGGRIEGANVNPILEMTELIEMSRHFELLQQLLQMEDERQNNVIDKIPAA